MLHVVGASEMAERLRGLYGSGAVEGWRLQPMASSRTPLESFEAAFDAVGQQYGGNRGYSQLFRAGFVYGEEVVACPDAALLQIRNIGGETLRKIRRIVGGPPDPIPAGAGPVGDRDRVAAARLLSGLLSDSTRARYPELVRGLEGSRMPPEAVEAIAQSLEREALPPTDSMVALLLDTAGEMRLLDIYRATHRTTAT